MSHDDFLLFLARDRMNHYEKNGYPINFTQESKTSNHQWNIITKYADGVCLFEQMEAEKRGLA